MTCFIYFFNVFRDLALPLQPFLFHVTAAFLLTWSYSNFLDNLIFLYSGVQNNL